MTSEQIQQDVYAMGKKARAAALSLAVLSEEKKNEILRAMAAGIRSAASEILAANAKDISAGEERGLTSAMLDRLRLDDTRLEAVAAGVEKVATLPDPVGEELGKWTRPNGIEIEQVRVPIGVIGIIYESRPNVTSDAAGLCLKSGNATILRGGSEGALATALQAGGEKAGLPEGAIQLIPFTDRESVAVMAGMDQYLDLIIPRGGKGLIETVVSLARMPVIKHYDGICHAYIHPEADQEMAVAIVVDSKTQKPSVCNALETLLVDEKIASEFLPKVAQALAEKKVELRGDEATRKIIEAGEATEEDWATEYLDYILAVKVVPSQTAAEKHINHYSSKHTETIVTKKMARNLASALRLVSPPTNSTLAAQWAYANSPRINTACAEKARPSPRRGKVRPGQLPESELYKISGFKNVRDIWDMHTVRRLVISTKKTHTWPAEDNDSAKRKKSGQKRCWFYPGSGCGLRVFFYCFFCARHSLGAILKSGSFLKAMTSECWWKNGRGISSKRWSRFLRSSGRAGQPKAKGWKSGIPIRWRFFVSMDLRPLSMCPQFWMGSITCGIFKSTRSLFNGI